MIKFKSSYNSLTRCNMWSCYIKDEQIGYTSRTQLGCFKANLNFIKAMI